MKKIYTLLLLFTITLFYSIPSEAYTLNGNDIPISELNGLTLNQLVNANILLDPTLWTFQQWDIVSYTINELIITSSNNSAGDFYGFSPSNFTNGDKYYSFIRAKATQNNEIVLYHSDLVSPFTITTEYQNISFNNIRLFSIYFFGSDDINVDLYIDLFYYPLIINTTDLGIDNLTPSQLDFYYYQWIQNNAFIEGYDDGFNVGYDEGFDDGVASDTSYAVGYALGLSEGTDMETGSSLLILIVAAIGFIMMIFGFATKRRIFNLLSVGAFIVLGGLLAEFVGFIIITVGLVFVNVYYTFFGDI
jgi:hypothetical protein